MNLETKMQELAEKAYPKEMYADFAQVIFKNGFEAALKALAEMGEGRQWVIGRKSNGYGEDFINGIKGGYSGIPHGESVHVIEYSSYLQALAKISELESTLKTREEAQTYDFNTRVDAEKACAGGTVKEYIQCPHCEAFMSIMGLTNKPATWTCQRDECNKKFEAKIVTVRYIKVVKK